MTKKFSKAEQFYISTNPDKMSIDRMADELGTTIKAIKPYFKEIELQESINPLPVVELAKHIDKRTGDVRATIMTEGASQAADEGRKERTRIAESVRNQSCIHRCKKKK